MRGNQLAWKLNTCTSQCAQKTFTNTYTLKKERKEENPLVHISVTTSPLLMTPLVSPSAHIYLSVGTAARAGVGVCVCDDLCVTDQCLSHCLRLGVCMFCLFSAKLKSLVTTYQRNIEFGHTRDSTQPPCQSSLFCFPLSHHPLFLLHSKLSCWQ